MEKEFVPYEQASALKELGFDELCLGYYLCRNSALGIDDLLITTEWIDLLPYDSSSCKVPTFSQAFRWFREKYDLCAYVVTAPNYIKGESKYKTRFSYAIYGMNEKSSSTVFILIRDAVNLSTHEEAELECLKKLIEIVKIVKNK
jgi:hypothetical protein